MQKPVVVIHYCTQCNWLLRSAWMAQELLHTLLLRTWPASRFAPAAAAYLK